MPRKNERINNVVPFSGITRDNYARKVAEYTLLKEQIAMLEARRAPLGDSIKDYVKTVGTKTDTGGYISDLGDLVVEARTRQKIEFDQQKVITVLINKPELLNQVLKAVPVIDEDMINTLYEKGDLTSDEVQRMATVTISHSLYVTKKEDMPEVEQKVAASAKKKFIPTSK